ncbi:GTP-binding protein Di-Ras2-like [Xenia sp. Carnegie-2017]|uniref:GTP-binding protein Di-Ras2-like n=1 Tax=Xenia sp. Carnegie-2017 TaxID=2897299 RepID=UPI001F041E07|nr:GTP-binding protein Di-Ras2-like [Xenia sp. Carnegie-2017]
MVTITRKNREFNMQSCFGPVINKLLPLKKQKNLKKEGNKRSHGTIMVKVIVLGSGSVGKTNIIRRYVHNEFNAEHEPTTEDVYENYFTSKRNKDSILFKIYDTAGSDQFPAMKRLTITQGDAFLVLYAVDDRESFNEAKTICREVFELKSDHVKSIMLVGNKCDLPTSGQAVSTEEASLAAKHLKCKFTESSARLGVNVEKIFRETLNDF